MRKDLVEHIKQQIEAGTYDTKKRLELAVQRMMEKEGLDDAD